MSLFDSRRARLFDFVLAVCIAFVLLTTLAMGFYPGGIQRNPHSIGYSLGLNFFSDLGRARSHSGAPNPVSSVLFKLALTSAGAALMVFFAAFASLFWTDLASRVFALLGAFFGALAGAGFIGVALITADRNSSLHIHYVLLAFRSFFAATLPLALAIGLQKTYPRRGAAIFLAFAGLLAAYIGLLLLGPSPQQPGGLWIQVVGQKLIVYASVVAVGLQSLLARRFLRGS